MTSRPAEFREVLARRHFPALDGLRAIAVSVVIVSHADYPIRHVPGDLGVSAFFVLSGFLITRLLMRELDATGSVSISRFYARRTLRIFPAYYVFLALSVTLDARHGQRWSPAFAASAATYTVNYFNAVNHHPVTSIAHAWSLGVEEQFYLLWPLAFITLARRGRKTVIGGTALVAIAVLIWRTCLQQAGVDIAYLYNAFDTRFDNLAIGCLLALVADYRVAQAYAARAAGRAWFPVITLAALSVSRVWTSSTYHYTVGFTIDALLIALLVVQLLQLYAAPLWSWLEHPLTRYLGRISYPIYLYHQWGASIGRRVPTTRPGIIFVAGVAAAILLASASYYGVERPFLKLKRRFSPSTDAVALG